MQDTAERCRRSGRCRHLHCWLAVADGDAHIWCEDFVLWKSVGALVGVKRRINGCGSLCG